MRHPIFLFFILFLSVVNSNAQEAVRKIPERVANESSIRELMSRSGPAGIVFLRDKDIEQKYNWNAKSLLLIDVLEGVIKTEPQYRLENNNGVYNLLPADKYPVLLDTVVSELELTNASVWQARDQLIALPELQQSATSLGYENYILPRIIMESRLGGVNHFSIKFKEKTIREILNEIVKFEGKAVWSFQEYSENGNKLFDLYFIHS